jgi:hypothetical protein
MRTVKVFRTRIAGKPVAIKFKTGMKNLADHWMAGKGNRNPRIPRGEVWVNAKLLKDREKLRRVLAHEKVELELMMRKGYSYRAAHRIANKREASLARRVKTALMLLLLALPLLAPSAGASPGLAVYSAPSLPWELLLGDPAFLPHSIVWSNSTHAQVLVYAPQAGTYYLLWQSQVYPRAPPSPAYFVKCGSSGCALVFDGSSTFVRFTDNLISSLAYQGQFTLFVWMNPYGCSDAVLLAYQIALPPATPSGGYVPLVHTLSSCSLRISMWNRAARIMSTGYTAWSTTAVAYVLNYTRSTDTLNITMYVNGVKTASSVSTGAPWNKIDYNIASTLYNVIGTGYGAEGGASRAINTSTSKAR